MKINTSKLKEHATKNTTLNLSKVKTTSNNITEEKKASTLSFRGLQHSQNSETIKNESPTNIKGLRSLKLTATPKVEESKQNISLVFTENKVYNLDKIVNDKRRDNASCPLIMKVNLQNENDREITELVTILILDDYLNANKNEEEKYSYDDLKANYSTLISDVPGFYHIFDSYFNKYYGYYYKQINAIGEGSISLDTVKETIVTAYNNYENLLGDELEEYVSNNVSNKPKVEYEMGTEPGDGGDIPDVSYLGLAAKDNKLFVTSSGEIIPGQEGIPFATINGEVILNSTTNFELLTLEDYIDLMESVILKSNNNCLLSSNDNLVIAATDIN